MDNDKSIEERMHKDLMELEKITRSDPKISKLSEEREKLEKEMLKIGKKN